MLNLDCNLYRIALWQIKGWPTVENLIAIVEELIAQREDVHPDKSNLEDGLKTALEETFVKK